MKKTVCSTIDLRQELAFPTDICISVQFCCSSRSQQESNSSVQKRHRFYIVGNEIVCSQVRYSCLKEFMAFEKQLHAIVLVSQISEA